MEPISPTTSVSCFWRKPTPRASLGGGGLTDRFLATHGDLTSHELQSKQRPLMWAAAGDAGWVQLEQNLCSLKSSGFSRVLGGWTLSLLGWWPLIWMSVIFKVACLNERRQSLNTLTVGALQLFTLDFSSPPQDYNLFFLTVEAFTCGMLPSIRGDNWELPNGLSHLPDYPKGLLLSFSIVLLRPVPITVTFSGPLGYLPLLPGITDLSLAQRATCRYKYGDFCGWV